jgi:hypothetical protein
LSLLQIIYSSQPFGFDEATLAGILLDARRCNSRDDITGALICRRDVFLQLLEGPEQRSATPSRGSAGTIGLDIVLHVDEPVSDRLFGSWAMLHDPDPSWLPARRTHRVEVSTA